MSKLGLLLLLILSLLTFQNIEAQSKSCIKLGGNVSQFSKLSQEPRLGTTLGFGYEWISKNNHAITGEIYIIQRATLLENKTIGSGEGFDYYVSYYNIHCSYAAFEPYVSFKKYFLITKSIKFNTFLGTSFSIGLLDFSSTQRIRRESLEGDERYNYDFDFIFSPRKGPLGSSGFSANAGFGINWQNLSLNCRYSMAFYKTEVLNNINIGKKLNSVHLVLGFSFDESL